MDNNAKKVVKSINRKLSLIFAIMLVVSIVAAELIVVGFGFKMVKDLVDSSLTNEVASDAGQINKELTATSSDTVSNAAKSVAEAVETINTNLDQFTI